ARLHGRRAMFPTDDDVHVTEHRLARDALVQNLDEPRLGLERAEQLAQPLNVGEVRLGEYVRRAVNVNVSGLLFLALDASLEQQDGVAEQTVVEGLLLAHQRQHFRANGLKALARKLRVEVARGTLQLFLRQALVNAYDLVLYDVRRED